MLTKNSFEYLNRRKKMFRFVDFKIQGKTYLFFKERSLGKSSAFWNIGFSGDE